MPEDPTRLPLGASVGADGKIRFLLWAPRTRRVEVLLPGGAVPMIALERGYHFAEVRSLVPGALYRYRLGGSKVLPDPASRAQPQGVEGPSALISPITVSRDRPSQRLDAASLSVYELHIGAFTPGGTFDSARRRMPELKALGVTAIELMPVACFPGQRNWGYDGVFPFCVQPSYGGPAGLKRLVEEAHRNGLGVIMDVVYNHIGPEGNCLPSFGPYFDRRRRTPWGPSLNFEGAARAEVRRFFIENALMWLSDFGIDGLRLDAVDEIPGRSRDSFLAELIRTVRVKTPGRLLIAETSRNEPCLLTPAAKGGIGFDAVWCDDLHHALHSRLTGERKGYYRGYGSLPLLAKAIDQGAALKKHGASRRVLRGSQMIVCSQNHDQIGNRLSADRLASLVSFEELKLAAATLLSTRFTPLLFMGEEDGERTPFNFFADYSLKGLSRRVQRGRKREFAAFAWKGAGAPLGRRQTFRDSVLRRKPPTGRAARLRELYRVLLRIHRCLRGLPEAEAPAVTVDARRQTITVRRGTRKEGSLTVLNFSKKTLRVKLPAPTEQWAECLDTSDGRWGGAGKEGLSAFSAVLYIRGAGLKKKIDRMLRCRR